MTKIVDNLNTVNYEDLEDGSVCKIGRDFYLKPARISRMMFPRGYNCICVNDGEFGYLKPEDKVTPVREMEAVAYGKV